MLSSEWYQRLTKIDRIRNLESEVESLSRRIEAWRKEHNELPSWNWLKHRIELLETDVQMLNNQIRMLHEYLGVKVVPGVSKLEYGQPR